MVRSDLVPNTQNTILDLIGNTPLVRIQNMTRHLPENINVLAKFGQWRKVVKYRQVDFDTILKKKNSNNLLKCMHLKGVIIFLTFNPKQV